MSGVTEASVWSACPRCQNETNHKILFSHQYEEDEYPEAVLYRVVCCRGCGTPSFRMEHHDRLNGYKSFGGDWQADVSVTSYPKIIEGHRDLRGLYWVPRTVSNIYRESLLAMRENALILAGLGMRGTIEAICKERNIAGRDLEKRITNMASSGLITKKDAERLHGIRFLGNDAAHDIKAPTIGQLTVALQIIEHLLNSLYVFEREVRGQLDHGISDVNELIELLNVSLSKLEVGMENSLRGFLGRDFRRLVGSSYATIQEELIGQIQSGAYQDLSVSAIAKDASGQKVQIFKLEKIPVNRESEIFESQAGSPEKT
jgi:hypothetical protein